MPERPPYQPPPWTDAGWLPAVTEWVRLQLAARGLEPGGPMTPRARAWSTVLEVPTSQGRVWFKTTAPSMASDARLTDLLAGLAADLVLAPIAVDAARGWMLLPDGGQRLRDAMDPAQRLDAWTAMLPRYAELQMASAARPELLFEAGALERRPGHLPSQLEALLEEPDSLLIGQQGGLSGEQVAEIRALLPRLGEVAQRLTGAGIPDAIQHDDLHDGNVLVTADGGSWIVDWGDAGIGHPFATLLVTLRSVESALELEGWSPYGEMRPELARLRDAYLEPWTILMPRDELVELVPLATWTGMIGRALTWRAALGHADYEQYAEFRDAVSGWLEELLAAAPA
jgi:Phosphotransferase enzyme family